jgi:hypothetical protein
MKLKKKKGNMETFISYIALLMIPLILIMNIKLKQIKLTKNLVEDGLVASNLSAATIDLKEYGTTQQIINDDFSKSFNDYTISLKDNLKLDDNFQPINNQGIICSKISIDNFTIYNVIGNDIQVISRSPDGSINNSTISNGAGVIKTPDGVLIKSTTIYSKISFKIKGYLTDIYNVYKEKSVDITDKE